MSGILSSLATISSLYAGSEDVVMAICAGTSYKMDFVKYVAVMAATGCKPSKGHLGYITDNTDLLPPELEEKWDMEQVRKELQKVKKTGSLDIERQKVDRLPVNMLSTDEELLAVFPARTKTDLSLRRTRMTDINRCYINEASEWREIVTDAWLYRWDYIFLTNVLVANYVCYDGWYKDLKYLGIFPTTLEDFVILSKKLTIIIKTRSVDDDRRWMWLETSGMVGYRNPPFPGFDMAAESKSLSSGGGERHFSVACSFTRAVREALKMDVTPIEYISFKEYIESDKWETTGSCSLGKVNWEYDGEEGVIRSRKNMVRDVVNNAEIYDYVLKQKTQVNRVVLKSELGKLRLAVAGDLATYLRMSWVNYYLNEAYTQWEGSTIDESLEEQSDRLVMMIEQLRSRHSLPFDFEGFDHQPTTEEIKEIVFDICLTARANVPYQGLIEFDRVVAEIIEGFDRSVLIYRNEAMKEVELKVTGGLMSGLRFTSLIGNAWNTCIMHMAKTTMRAMGVICDVDMYIRGDDSVLIADEWSQCMLLKICLDYIKARGGEGKFSIRYGETEFLRQWISSDVRGYACRVLPGWVQRKPWSNTPWSASNVFDALDQTRKTLVRRGVDPVRMQEVWESAYDYWCKSKSVSKNWFALPKSLGGLGYNRWEYLRTDKVFPSGTLPKIHINNIADDAIFEKQEGFKEDTDQVLSAEFGRKMVEEELVRKIGADEVTSMVKFFRDLANKGLRNLRCKWFKVSRPYSYLTWSRRFVLSELDAAVGVIEVLKMLVYKSSYGVGKATQAVWERWQTYKRYVDIRPVQLLERRSFASYILLKTLEHRGLKRKQALDWIFGSLTLPDCGMNPLANQIIEMGVVALLGDPLQRHWTEGEWETTVYDYTVYASLELSNSRWYRELMCW